jgi:hypothetical protein
MADEQACFIYRSGGPELDITTFLEPKHPFGEHFGHRSYCFIVSLLVAESELMEVRLLQASHEEQGNYTGTNIMT